MTAGALVFALVIALLGTARECADIVAARRVRRRLDPRAPRRSWWPPRVALLDRTLRPWRVARADAALPDWLDLTARSVRAGESLPLALRSAAAPMHATPLGPDVGRVDARLRDGASIEDALAELAPSGATGPRRLVVRALTLASTAGGTPGTVLDGVSATLRDRLALQREVRALSSQARASAAVIVAAPAAFAALGSMADARVGAFLFTTAAGWSCLLGGVALEAAGGMWMARLVRSERWG